MKSIFCTPKKTFFFVDFGSNLATKGSGHLEASVGMIHKSYLSQFELAIEVDHLNNFKVMMIANLLL